MMMMDFEASDKLKFCDFDDDDDGNFHVKDDVPFSQRLSPFATCNCKHDVSVKIRDDDTTIMPVKRVFDKNGSLHISVKKSKVTPDYDDEKEGHDISLSPKESALVEKSFKKCERKRRLAENSLKSINREIEECQKELRNKKTQVSCVRKINEIHNEMRGKVERKEEELNALSRKIAECTMELEFTKKELQSERKMLRQVISTRQKRNDFAVQRRKFESMKKRFEGQVKELESKLKQSEGQVEELESNEKYFKEWAKALESRDKQLNGRMMEFELMEEELESRKKKLESEEKLLERREMKLESKENQLESREKKIETKEQRIEEQEKELQSKENQFVGRVKEFESEKDKFEVNLRALGMELVSKQKQIYSRTRVVESREKELEGRVEDLKSKQKEFEVRWKDLYSKENNFKVKVEKHKLKEKQFEGQVKELETKLSEFDGQLNEPELRGKEYEALMKQIDEEKESDFVENVIRRKQFVGAGRFSYAYNLASKNHSVDILREHVQNAKLISESSCEKTNSIEIKDKARDQEIASLRTVLQCISDNNVVESEELLKKEIRHRILELKAQKGN